MSAKKHSLSSYLVNNTIQSYMNFPYLKLPPNQTCLVSPGWPGRCSAHTDQSGAGQPDQSLECPDHSLSLDWWLTHNSCLACDLSLVWRCEWERRLTRDPHLTTSPPLESEYSQQSPMMIKCRVFMAEQTSTAAEWFSGLMLYRR